MFNEQSIGKRVVSQQYGLGTVAEFRQGYHFPVKIDWDTPPARDREKQACYFTAKGWWDLDGKYPDSNITLAYQKQGTPEARRIVAMLAWEYRRHKTKPQGYSDPNDEGFYVGYSEALLDVYQQAKQLLGESK